MPHDPVDLGGDSLNSLKSKVQNSEYFGSNGALRLAKKRLGWARNTPALIEIVDALSVYSEVCDHAAEYAQAKCRMCRLPEWPLWEFLVWQCLRHALRLSNQVLECVGSISKLTIEQLNIRQSVLRRTASRASDRGKPELLLAANQCLDEALGRPGIPHSTKALLLIGKVDILTQMRGQVAAGVDMQKLLYDIEAIAEQVSDSDFLQASRIYRRYAMVLRKDTRYPESLQAADQALKFARRAEAPDEEFKAGAL